MRYSDNYNIMFQIRNSHGNQQLLNQRRFFLQLCTKLIRYSLNIPRRHESASNSSTSTRMAVIRVRMSR